VQVHPYLDFNGRCDEAVEFYRHAVGAVVTEPIHRFKDAPDQSMCAPGTGNKVMHMSFRIGDLTMFASDGHCKGQSNFQGVSLSINVTSVAEGERLFAALAEGGQVSMPFAKTFFSPGFGMLTDRFGVPWMIHVTA
jgi:PhnB protein